MTDLHAALRQHFDFPEFRPGQAAALEHVLAGRDTLVVMPTGSGKSLIYQLAALMLPGTALIVSPLIALMKDQVDGLARRGLAATFINSSLDSAEQTRRLRGLAAGEYKMVLVAPERLRSRIFQQALAHASLSLLAVDEAHCLSQWGHDFRPDYLHVAEARRELQAPVTLALTATATPHVQDDILRLLELPNAARLVAGFNRPNLSFEVWPAASLDAKHKLLAGVVREMFPAGANGRNGGGIIYAGTRRDSEAVAAFVTDRLGVPARPYHAGLDSATRSEVQDAFLSGDLPVVAATNAFGLGIDRPDVRFVLHYAVPASLEAYYQEAGRAGRDGLPARAVLLYAARDSFVHQHFIENDTPTGRELRAVHTFLSSPEAAQGVSREALAGAMGVGEVKLRVALEQLEAAGALRRLPDDGYDALRVEAASLPERALADLARQVEARRAHKRKQLDIMLAFAETDDCRRETLLQHFGDDAPAVAEVEPCCDRCAARDAAPEAEAPARPAETKAEFAALVVLDTVRHLAWPIGADRLAQVLKGSASKDTANYAKARNFGKLAILRLKAIKDLIAELLSGGYLKSAGGTRPVLSLTPRGDTALNGRHAIPLGGVRLGIPGAPAASRSPARFRGAPGATVQESGRLLKAGQTPEQIAATRGLTLETIYSHLADLIGEGQADINAVVPADVQAQVRAAIAQVGSVQYLSPLKAVLPSAVSYGAIRCVVADYRRGLSGPPKLGLGADEAAVDSKPVDAGVAVGTVSGRRVVNVILACVAALSGRLSRSTAAKVLVAALVDEALAYAEHPMYGRLAGYGRQTVTGYVDALLAEGRIAQDASGRLVPVSPAPPAVPPADPLPSLDLIPPSARARAAEVHALGKGRDLAAVPKLIAALDDPDGNVRRLAASALGKLRAAEATPAIVQRLSVETMSQVRQYLIVALGRIGDERANPTLARIAADPAESNYVRAAARRALGGS